MYCKHLYLIQDLLWQVIAGMSSFESDRHFISFIPSAHVTPPGSAPTHRAGREPGTPVREAGALPRRLKATASSVSR